jgi:hypothetical protein
MQLFLKKKSFFLIGSFLLLAGFFCVFTLTNKAEAAETSNSGEGCVYTWQFDANDWVWVCDSDIEPATSTPQIDPQLSIGCHYAWLFSANDWVWLCDQEPVISILPSITLSKTVINGDNMPSDWHFIVSPGIDDQTDFYIPEGSSSVVIENVPDSIYTISESGPEGYALSYEDSTGESCVFDGNAYATVAAGNPATNAVCNFVNIYNEEEDENENNGGGENGGDTEHNLIISDEFSLVINSSEVRISWTTNVPATSRVVYGRYSVPTPMPCQEEEGMENPSGTCLWGYENTTVEDSVMTTTHSVVVDGLPGATLYYFRPVSHASPEEVGIELSATTPSGGSNGGGSGSNSGIIDYGGTGGQPLNPEKKVAGEKITDEPTSSTISDDTTPVNQIVSDLNDPGEASITPPQEVAGFTTLPESGIDYSLYILSLILAMGCFGGVLRLSSKAV